MSQQNRQWFMFIVILIVFSLGVLIHQSVFPVLEGNDELLHYNYIVWLRVHHALPDRATRRTNITQQESGQAPLTYWVAATLLDALHTPLETTDTFTQLSNVRNRWFTPPDLTNYQDNFNQYFHGSTELEAKYPDVALNSRIARLLSLVYGIIAVVGVYGLACEFFKTGKWVLFCTALFAFSPVFMHMCAMINNDIAATAFASLLLWQIMVLFRTGATPFRLILIGLFFSLAALSKVNSLLLAPAIILAVVFDARNREHSIARIILNFASIFLVIGLVFGPWMLYGWLNYRDPIGMNTQINETAYMTPTVQQVISALPGVYTSYLAIFGTSTIRLHPLVYLLLSLLIAVSVWGSVSYWRHISWNKPEGQRVITAVVVVLVALLALLYWLIKLFHVQLTIVGRLIYFVHPLIIVAVTGGLFLLSKRISRRQSMFVQICTLGLLMSMSIVLAPVRLWSVFSTPPMLTREQLPMLNGSAIDYGASVRYLGYSLKDNMTLQNNGLYQVKLCWEILKPTSENVAFSVKLFDNAGRLQGGRTSTHGLGRYVSTSWKVGDVFCDDVDVPLQDAVSPAQVYNVWLSVDNFDNKPWEAIDTLSQRKIDAPFIFQAVSPANDMSKVETSNWNPVSISFDSFADLTGVFIEGEPKSGGTFKIKLRWNVRGKTPDEWHEFIHLTNDSQSIPLAAGTPRNGLYPTWAWTPGETIIDTWTLQLPENLASGTYKLRIGFFNPVSSQRMEVTQSGSVVPDRNPVAAELHVN